MEFESLTHKELKEHARKYHKHTFLSVATKEELISICKGIATPQELQAKRFGGGSGAPKDDAQKTVSDDAEAYQAFLKLTQSFKGQLDETRVVELIKEHSNMVQPLQYIINGVEMPKLEEHTHPKFSMVMGLCSINLPVLLVGNAGTGKGVLARQVAKALGLEYSETCFSSGVSESHLLGRRLPTSNGAWEYIPSLFVSAWENGGVHLLDEIDSADANVLMVINSALASDTLSLANEGKMIPKHPDCKIICAGNTFGRGATMQFAGRNQLDSATLDRFSVSTVIVDYDKGFEKAVAGDTPELLNFVWNTRQAIEDNHLRRICSTRFLVRAHACMKALNWNMEQIREQYFTSWSKEEQAKVVK